MNWMKQIPMATFAVILGTISTIGWIALDGTPPLIISIVAGALIAVKATLAGN